jgi:ribosomal protein S8
MKNKILVLLTLAMMGFGGYVGYTTNYVNTATANEVKLPRLIDVPRTQGFNLDINLNNGHVTCNSQEQDVKVNIERKDSIIYRTRVVTREVTKHVKVRELPSMRENKQKLSNLCKIETNLNRTQN